MFDAKLALVVSGKEKNKTDMNFSFRKLIKWVGLVAMLEKTPTKKKKKKK